MARVNLDEAETAVDDDDIAWGDEGAPKGFPDGDEPQSGAIISINGKVMGNLDDLVKQPTEELKDAMRGLVERAIEPQPRFDYRQIDEQYRDEVKEASMVIRAQSHAVRKSILTIGRRLIEVKGMLPHGVFGEWIAAEFGMSERMGQNLMNVAREYEGKSETISFLSDSVLYLLAAPSTPEEARAEIERVAAQGQKVTVPFARQVVAKTKAERKIEALRKPTTTPAPEPTTPTYLTPEPKHEPSVLTVKIADPLVRELVHTNIGMNLFKRALQDATLAQLEQALHICSSDADKRRFLKLGNRRELLLAAKDAQRVDEAIEAAMPLVAGESEPKPAVITPDDLAAAGITIVSAQDGNGWRWKRANGEGGNVYGAPYAEAADAIEHLRRSIDILNTYPAAMIERGLKAMSKDEPPSEAAPEPSKALPLSPLPDERLEDAQNLRLCLVESRELCRRQFGELTGRHSLLPAYERAVADLLGPLDSLIGILDEKASA